MKFTFLFFLLFITGVSQATDYFVSTTGSDSNNGTSQTTPWKTLSKVESVCNAGTIRPGDRILFKCGDQFTGFMTIASIWGKNAKSGTAASPITLGSYGTGAKPVFLYPQGGSTAAESRVEMWFAGVDYWVVDGLNFTDLDVTNNKVAPANLGVPLYLGSNGDATCNHWTIKNVDISLCGMGIVLVGSFNTVMDCNLTNFKNLKSTPASVGAYEDYGANPFTLIDGNDNVITNNYVSGGWAESLDFGFNGGFCEMFGSSSRNKFMYNTIIDCNGISEFGANGATATSSDNLYAYNKIIDCGAMFYCNISGPFACQVGNVQFYNNTVVETNNSRFAQGSTSAGAGVTSPEAISHLNVDQYMFLYNGSPLASTVFALKNNIFNISNPLDIARSSESKMTHDYGVYKLSGGSTLGVALNTHEISTSAAVFTNTASPSATGWDLKLSATSPAIDAGTSVGISLDFVGNPVPTVPNAGIYESVAGTSTLSATTTGGTISCFGGTTTVTVTGSGGVSPYTGTGTFTVSAGTHTYNVTDAAGTVKTTSITITQPTAVLASVSAGTIATFGGTTNVTVTAGGGTSGYTYKLNSGAYQSSNIFTGVSAGTHTVTIKDANGCLAPAASITINQPAASNPVVATSTAGIINCNGGTTTVTVSGTGGVTPYTGTGTFTVGAGTYNYTVTDAAGSSAITTITVAGPTALNLAVSSGTIATFGGTTSITNTCSGGTPAYTYKLNNGAYQSSSTFTNVAAGTHTVTVQDSKGCTSVKTIIITQPAMTSVLVASSTVGTINCNGGTTTVTVTATGGTAPYTGTGTFTVNAGPYSYTVTDAAGSAKTTSGTVTQPTAITVAVVAGTVSGASGTTTATVTASGGTPGYTYNIDGGSYQSSNVFTAVAAGNHTINVRDGRACTKSKIFTVSQVDAAPLVITAVSTTISCYGSSANITISATGGTAPYTGTGTFSVNAGTYTYTVTDASGTSGTTSITVNQPTAIVTTATAGTITVNGGTTTITAGATGGTAPYTYKLNNGVYQASSTFTGVAAGTHTITAKDSRGCTSIKTLTITQPTTTTAFKLNLISKTNETCKGRKDGKIIVSCTGGTAPYTYRLNYGTYGSSGTFTNLKPGLYIVTGKSATGATSTIYIFINSSRTACTGKIIEAAKGNTDPVTETRQPETKLPEQGDLKINVFPNPTATEFSLMIEHGSMEDAFITVTNVSGIKVYQGRTKQYNKTRFGLNFIPGIYFVKVVQGNTVQNVKLIKAN